MKKLLIFAIILAALSLLTAAWWINGNSAVNSKDKTPKIFIVRKGQGVREIAANLKSEGLIKDPIVFFLITKKNGYDKKIEAGDFRLKPSMTTEQVAEALTHGTLDIWVTIPEGYRALQIAELLEKDLPTYDPTWKDELVKNEGYLFPDTYLVPKNADAALFVKILRDNFEQKYATLDTSSTNLSQDEIVTVASLIEREAKMEKDRPMVASVILNRLGIGMKLDIDATLQYMLGYQEDEKRWWKKSLTNDDKEVESPYNTYKNAGLPPTPISNPGISSLRAVVSPAKTNFLFYISDKSGINRYARTMAEHEANIKRYGL